jgi:hypothetical protein
MNLYPDHYKDELYKNHGHLAHCIGQVRQTLMCGGDMSINVYQWSRPHGSAILRTDIPHTCRDFEQLQNWVKENWYPDFDDHNLTTWMDDGLGKYFD